MKAPFLTLTSLSLGVISLIALQSIPPLVAQQIASPMPDVNQVTDNTLDSLNLAKTVRPVAGSTRMGNNPVLFLIGNSTMRTGTLGNGQNGQWGWGYFFQDMFDTNRITVENHALGGMSSRTFYNCLWGDVLPGIRQGDWVIIELGHNDNGPYDSGRARASIPGTGNDSLTVVIKETGEKETVYTYGEYMRRFIADVRERGATPILFSLTPRNAWEDKDSTVISRVNKTFGAWAREVAETENVPFVDLNEITARKFERFGKEKVKTMFYLDRIHTSEFGAKVNAASAAEGLLALEGVELKDYLLPAVQDTLTGATRKEGQPMLFIIGDSTVKNEDSGDDSMWGWGSVIAENFDTTAMTIENHAMAGRSARTFLDEGRWDKVYDALQPGDFVLMQFGHNDGGDINTGKARGELHGSSSESKVFKMEKTGRNQVIYTYGWYIRKFIMDALEKGAVPIVLSHTPRNRWTDGKIESNAATFGKWAREAAKHTDAYFIDLNAISGKKLQALGEGRTDKFFKNDHTHTSKEGARLNAASIAEGLRATDCELKNYLLPASYSFRLDDRIPSYNEFDGYGYDFDTRPSADGKQPFYFSTRLPDGNYKVTVSLGNRKRASSTIVRAESRRLMLEKADIDRNKEGQYTFIVNKRSPAITLTDSVQLNDREVNTPTWDDKLTLELTGYTPAVTDVEITPVENGDSVRILFLFGDSTVTDQTNEPWTSWGQIIPAYFDSNVAVANFAESGESCTSFIAEKRLDKALSMARPGDFVLIQFGHNDQKERGAGKGAYYNFTHNLKYIADKVREKGVIPIVVTPTARRTFDNEGKVINTHLDYPKAMREMAAREGIPLIDLNAMSMTLYETLGIEGSKKAFVHYPAGTFRGQTSDLKDNTHFNPYGATQIARCVTEGIRQNVPGLAKYLKSHIPYNPATPDNLESFYWPDAMFIDINKPYGN